MQPAAAALRAGSSAAQRLAALEELCLHQRAGNPGKGMAALLQALLPHTSQQLKWLKLQGVAAQLAMPIVAQLRGLRQLQLRSCQLTHLPSGPYLEGAIGCMPAGDWLHAGCPQLTYCMQGGVGAVAWTCASGSFIQVLPESLHLCRCCCMQAWSFWTCGATPWSPCRCSCPRR